MEKQKEFEIKLDRVRKYLETAGADGVALNRCDYFAWATCGGSTYVNVAGDTGVATLLVTRDSAVVLTNRIEEQRLLDEELSGLPVNVVALPWQENSQRFAIKEFIKGKKFLCDSPFADCAALPSDFERLMYELTENEIERFRGLGELTGAAMGRTCKEISRGMSENEAGGLLARNFLDAGVFPVVILVAADERLKKYRHPLPTANKIDKIVMVVVCGRRHGLIASCTRIVNFGAIDAELRRKHLACVAVDVALNMGTRPGRRLGDIFGEAQAVYRESGFDGEWNLHHQGGSAGYRGRYIFATEDCDEVVAANTAYAWNPSITGTKSEDTLIVLAEGNEFITPTPDWPMVRVEYKGRQVERPDILAL